MRIHRRLHEEGTLPIMVSALSIAIAVAVICWIWPRQSIWHGVFYAFAFVFIVLIMRFFRIPIHRKTTIDPDSVLSPADGLVAANEVVMEDEYFHDERRQLSIFMSIHNVHVNFFPFDGVVAYYKYHPGKFLMAIKPKSSTDNERNTIVLKDGKGREILVRQIAGFVARRIVCDLKVGDEAIAGEELGMIRFGSRVDVFLPLDAEVKVEMNQKTTAKETILAVMK